ncbi:MAG TPA: hypothetical protein VFE37_15990 [Chloroflexota bacterium]|nr:hypothetical protein [Chloroflexota bacterium]
MRRDVSAADGAQPVSEAEAVAFAPADASALREAGWTLLRLPAGLTLAGLRVGGAPFKGTRYFDQQAPATAERTTVATDVAYKPALLPGSFNRPFADAARLLDEMLAHLPPGVAATIGPAAAYVWLLEQHRAATGAYPFAQLFAWAVDEYQARARLVVGVFGQQRPLLVAPLVEGRGGGVGVWPLLVPRAALPALWPLAPPPA